jgi:hypothetical protein
MSNRLFPTLVVRFIVLLAAGIAAAAAFPQCGTYFTPGYRAVGKIGPSSVTGRNYDLADWTGDGRSDFWNVRTIALDQPRMVRIFPALPAGGWDWDNPINYTINIPAAQFPDFQTFVIRDFDNDGRIDMLVTTQNPNSQLIMLRNPGDGTLQPGTPSPNFPTTTDFARPIGFADVNSDNRLDRIYSQQNSSNLSEVISYSLLNADGSFGPPVAVLAHAPENGVTGSTKVVGDFDGDGKVDIAYIGSTISGVKLRMLRNLGNGTFAAATESPATARGFDVADLNGDGRADIVGRVSAQFVIYFGQTDGTFISNGYAARNGINSIPNLRLADLTGDGRIDMLNVGAQDYEAFINSAAGTFTMNYYPRVLRTDGTILFRLEDFTGDGKADMIDLSHNVKNLFGDEVVLVQANTCTSRGHTRGLNFDSAGPQDFALWNGTTGDWTTVNGDWPQSGVLTTGTFRWGSGALNDVPAPGDFDGDGKSDHSVYRPGEGNWYIFGSATGSWSVVRFGSPGDVPVPGDYDGGGKTDVAVFRPSDGNWYILFSETQAFGAVHWGTNGDLAVPADYDGDDKIDIAVFRPSAGDWYFLKSSDGSYGIVHWGMNGDVPVPADYDGDGKADLTVFRSGAWHISRSSNNAYTVFTWGLAPDRPIPLLEAGDIAYPVVYRPGNARWFHPRYQLSPVTTAGRGSPVRAGLPNN